jgi:hypothetical protein
MQHRKDGNQQKGRHAKPNSHPGQARRRSAQVGGVLAVVAAGAAIAAPHIEGGGTARPVTAITARVQGLARNAMVLFNQSEREEQGYTHLSNHGHTATINVPTSNGYTTLTVNSSSRQRNPNGNGRWEPNPKTVTSFMAHALTPAGVNGPTFTRNQNGNGSWKIQDTYPQHGTQKTTTTRLVNGVPQTETIESQMGERPRIDGQISGPAAAEATIAVSSEVAIGYLDATLHDIAAPQQPQLPPSTTTIV